MKITWRKPGYALATILVLLGVAMFGAGTVVTISTLESKISRSQQEGLTAYYVAEAGVQDAIWRLNNDVTYANAMGAGTMTTPVTYTLNNLPAAGQTIDVSIVSDTSKGPGYGKITATGSSDNGIFVARRVVEVNVFAGPIGSPTGTNAMMAGASGSITNHSTNMQLIGGDMYAGGNINLNLGSGGTLNLGTGRIITSGSYSTNSPGSVTSGGIVPNAPTQTPPGFDFAYYSDPSHYSAYYDSSSSNAFQNAITSGAGLPGPVTYYNGNLTINNWAKNKTLRINGMLIVNGSLTYSASGADIVVTDPGSGKAGVFINGNLSNNNGAWHVDGVLYASGNMNFNNTSPTVVNGGIVGGQSLSFNTGVQLVLTYVASRMGSSFGTGVTYITTARHWEEEY